MVPRRPPPEPVRLVLYTRDDCPLCEEMKRQVSGGRVPVRLEEVDVDADPELQRRFGLSVPVLEIDGRIVCEGRLVPDDFERALARAARGGELC